MNTMSASHNIEIIPPCWKAYGFDKSPKPTNVFTTVAAAWVVVNPPFLAEIRTDDFCEIAGRSLGVVTDIRASVIPRLSCLMSVGSSDFVLSIFFLFFPDSVQAVTLWRKTKR